jgi:hypothetical protein
VLLRLGERFRVGAVLDDLGVQRLARFEVPVVVMLSAFEFRVGLRMKSLRFLVGLFLHAVLVSKPPLLLDVGAFIPSRRDLLLPLQSSPCERRVPLRLPRLGIARAGL